MKLLEQIIFLLQHLDLLLEIHILQLQLILVHDAIFREIKGRKTHCEKALDELISAAAQRCGSKLQVHTGLVCDRESRSALMLSKKSRRTNTN